MAQGIKYSVRQGDCISSIAYEHGFFWETIWNHAENSRLKDQREDPNILHPGDEVFVPDKEEKQESCACEQKHQFKKKGVPAKLRLRLMNEPQRDEQQRQPARAQYPRPKDLQGEDSQEQSEEAEDSPRSNIPYRVIIDGVATDGQTDEDGKLEITIPPNARSGELILEPGTPQEAAIPLCLGHLNSIDTVSGVKQRLANLTFDCGDATEDETEAYAEAIRAFQRKYGLEDSGEMDDQTRQKLQEVHGD